MKATFIETSGFTEAITELMSDEAYAELQRALMTNPNAGTAMMGCGGLRKIRTGDPKQAQGKRGGARVIYLHVPAAKRFYMLDAYRKNEKDDLTAGEKKLLRRLAQRLKVEATLAYRRWLKENE